jgi:hypothetical protein
LLFIIEDNESSGLNGDPLLVEPLQDTHIEYRIVSIDDDHPVPDVLDDFLPSHGGDFREVVPDHGEGENAAVTMKPTTVRSYPTSPVVVEMFNDTRAVTAHCIRKEEGHSYAELVDRVSLIPAVCDLLGINGSIESL